MIFPVFQVHRDVVHVCADHLRLQYAGTVLNPGHAAASEVLLTTFIGLIVAQTLDVLQCYSVFRHAVVSMR